MSISFTLTWADDFNGAANSDVWRYDAGAGANFGTGEVETTTTSTANVYQDGAGHLLLKALRVDLGATHTISQVTLSWEAATRRRTRSRPRPTAPRGRRSTRPRPEPAACRRSTSPAPAATCE
jgi:hypothetical protein